MTSYPRYAFGRDIVDDYPCPAQAAGLDTAVNEHARAVADRYDGAVRTELGTDIAETKEGTVEPERAEACWRKAVQEAEREDGPNVANVGREIADKLGWNV